MIFIKKQRTFNALGHESMKNHLFLIGSGVEFKDASSEINGLGYEFDGLGYDFH